MAYQFSHKRLWMFENLQLQFKWLSIFSLRNFYTFLLIFGYLSLEIDLETNAILLIHHY